MGERSVLSLPSIPPDEARSIILGNVAVSTARCAVSGCSVGAGVVVSGGVSIEMIVCVDSNFKWTPSRAGFYSGP